MDKKVYFLTYDAPSTGTSRLHSAIDSSPKISDWCHYIKTSYFIVSTSSSQELYDELKPSLDDENFIIMQVRSNRNRQGWLPKKAWEWLDGYNHLT